jgi:hypothetical protein
MERNGFAWSEGLAGNSSGGPFACGEYVRGNRKLELHFRFSLGLVTYHIGDLSIAHEEYMRHTGHRKDSAYPGFSDDPMHAFQSLAHDLSSYCQDFLIGSGVEFSAVHAAANSSKRQRGFAQLGE